MFGCAPRAQNSTEVRDDQNTDGLLAGEVLKSEQKYPAQRAVVIFQTLDKNGIPGSSCTAVLIAPNVALTAAHCLQTAFVSFRMAFALETTAVNIKYLPGHKFVVHPLNRSINPEIVFEFKNPPYTQKTPFRLRYDLALVSFKGKVPKGYRPAKIDTDKGADRSGESIYAYGYGNRQHPYQVDSSQLGTLLYGSLTRGKMQIDSDFHRFEDFYLTSESSETQVCNGDSGGPQFLANAKEPTVVGIHSARHVNWAIEKHHNSQCGDVSIVAKVAPFADWILETKKALERAL